MKTLLLPLVFLLGCTLSLQAAELRDSGKCQIQQAGPFDDDKVVKISLSNDQLELEANLRADDFVGDYALFAIPSITNKSEENLSCSWNIAFFDAEGQLVAALSQATEVGGGSKDFQLASCLATLPKAVIQRIAAYEAVCYVNPAPQAE